MNLHEREKLTAFLQQLTQTQAGLKDADADTMIRGALARQPDAGYLLVQRAMQLEYLLQETKSQCSQLQADLDKARSTTQGSFVNDMNAWGMKPAGLPSATATATAVSAPGFGTQAHVPMRAPSAVGTSPWGGGILGNVATTAAGVVAGSFLFQGIQNLMGHHAPGERSQDAHASQPLAGNLNIGNEFDTNSLADPNYSAGTEVDTGGNEEA